jgi:asparagine synthase (glutamine-hydrolysing)
MCGIAGFNWADSGLVRQMIRTLEHRGKEGEGVFTDERMSLGHRRQSIYDRSEKGRQPMHYEHFVLIFDGEIYNYQDIRKQLKVMGHEFASNSDAEVVLHAYQQWGYDFVNRLNGTWALCIYNRKEHKLFLSRDRFGAKPLYYFWDGQKFIFASEINALRVHSIPLDLDWQAANYYFYQKYVGGEQTIYQNVFQLAPSGILIVDLLSKELSLQPFFELDKSVKSEGERPLKERLSRIPFLLKDAVRLRSNSDLPLGSYLTGDVETAIVSYLASLERKELNTFSVGYKEKNTAEIAFAEKLAKQIRSRHFHEWTDWDETFIPKLIEKMDEPFGDLSVFSTANLARKAESGVKVVLTGFGANEVFGGNSSYKAHTISNWIPSLLMYAGRPFTALLPVSEKNGHWGFRMRKFFKDYHSNTTRRHLNWLSAMNETQRGQLLKTNSVSNEQLIPVGKQNGLISSQMSDMNYLLSGNVLKSVDLASRLYSLETRSPYLDHRLASLVLSLPESFKVKGLQTKWLLRKISRPYIPQEMIARMRPCPQPSVSKWMKESPLFKEYVLGETYYADQMLSLEYVQKLFQEHANRKNDHSRALWLIFVWNYWNLHHKK